MASPGWPRRYPIAQPPNAPLSLALVGLVVAWLTSGSAHDYARGWFYAFLAAWAWLEVSAGVNLFRRVLGAAFLVYVIVQIARALGA